MVWQLRIDCFFIACSTNMEFLSLCRMHFVLHDRGVGFQELLDHFVPMQWLTQ